MTTRTNTGITLNFMPSTPESVPLEVQVMVEPGGMLAPGGTVTLTCETPAQSSVQIHWIKDVSDLETGLGGWEVDRHITGN